MLEGFNSLACVIFERNWLFPSFIFIFLVLIEFFYWHRLLFLNLKIVWRLSFLRLYIRFFTFWPSLLWTHVIVVWTSYCLLIFWNIRISLQRIFVFTRILVFAWKPWTTVIICRLFHVHVVSLVQILIDTQIVLMFNRAHQIVLRFNRAQYLVLLKMLGQHISFPILVDRNLIWLGIRSSLGFATSEYWVFFLFALRKSFAGNQIIPR